MGKTLYLDCTNGISGDMTVAALLDLGANEARLRDTLASLPVTGYGISVSRVKKAGIECCDFDVTLDAAHENHDHDMAYLHGDGGHDHDHCCHAHRHDDHDEGCCHGHGHHHDHGHCHHEHGHDGVAVHDHAGHHHHEHRGPSDIDAIIDAGQLAPRARELAHRMVDILARAEAKAHAVPLEEVHFHEVGAVDSIVDIVSVAVLIDDLDITRVIVPRLVDGRGTVRCQHGIIPVPVPATLNIVEACGLPLALSDVEGELVTPTGAAVVAALDAERDLPARFRVVRTGLGAGKRSYERPSILRALVIEDLDCEDGRPDRPVPPVMSGEPWAEPTVGADAPTEIVRLECDIDDSTGEELAFAAERVREAGAREVHWVPVFTKKERPAWQLQVVAAAADVPAVERAIFTHTTTIGIRRWTCARSVLQREDIALETPFGPVRAKRLVLPDGSVRVKPEYADCARIARERNIPLAAVQGAVRKAAEL